MTTAALGGDGFDMGRVVSRTFGVLRRNLLPFYLIALILNGLPTVILQWTSLSQGWGGTPGVVRALNPAAAVFSVVNLLVLLFTTFLMQGALTFGSIEDLNGRKADVRSMFRAGVGSWLPLLGIAMIYSFGVTLGIILLIVPGVILLTMWAVVAPVEVVERKGVFGSFNRSQALTKGSRWPIFGLIVVYFIAALAVGTLVGVVIGVVFVGVALGSGVPLAMSGGVLSYVTTGLNMFVSVFVNVLGAVGLAAVYYELRMAKDGIGPETLANVFS